MTNLSEQQKNGIKSMCKQMLDLEQQQKKELDTTTLKMVVVKILTMTGLEGSNEEINDMVRDLEYEVSVRHTKGVLYLTTMKQSIVGIGICPFKNNLFGKDTAASCRKNRH